VLAAYSAEPAPGVQALVLEHIAVSLNPRQGLAGGSRHRQYRAHLAGRPAGEVIARAAAFFSQVHASDSGGRDACAARDQVSASLAARHHPRGTKTMR